MSVPCIETILCPGTDMRMSVLCTKPTWAMYFSEMNIKIIFNLFEPILLCKFQTKLGACFLTTHMTYKLNFKHIRYSNEKHLNYFDNVNYSLL